LCSRNRDLATVTSRKRIYILKDGYDIGYVDAKTGKILDMVFKDELK
jgi:hypothetical protein